MASNVVVKDVSVGKNSIVGAGSVVTKDLGPNRIYVATLLKRYLICKK